MHASKFRSSQSKLCSARRTCRLAVSNMRSHNQLTSDFQRCYMLLLQLARWCNSHIHRAEYLLQHSHEATSPPSATRQPAPSDGGRSHRPQSCDSNGSTSRSPWSICHCHSEDFHFVDCDCWGCFSVRRRHREEDY